MPMDGLPHPAKGGVVTAIGGRVHAFMPGDPVVTAPVTLLTGQTLVKFSVLGKVTASGKYKLSASAAGDGSEVPSAILLEDVDTANPAGDVDFAVMMKGKINPEVLVLGAGHTVASVATALRMAGILLETPY